MYLAPLLSVWTMITDIKKYTIIWFETILVSHLKHYRPPETPISSPSAVRPHKVAVLYPEHCLFGNSRSSTSSEVFHYSKRSPGLVYNVEQVPLSSICWYCLLPALLCYSWCVPTNQRGVRQTNLNGIFKLSAATHQMYPRKPASMECTKPWSNTTFLLLSSSWVIWKTFVLIVPLRSWGRTDPKNVCLRIQRSG